MGSRTLIDLAISYSIKIDTQTAPSCKITDYQFILEEVNVRIKK